MRKIINECWPPLEVIEQNPAIQKRLTAMIARHLKRKRHRDRKKPIDIRKLEFALVLRSVRTELHDPFLFQRRMPIDIQNAYHIKLEPAAPIVKTICLLCDQAKDTRAGVCFACSRFVAGKQLWFAPHMPASHELWDTRDPRKRWLVDTEGVFTPQEPKP